MAKELPGYYLTSLFHKINMFGFAKCKAKIKLSGKKLGELVEGPACVHVVSNLSFWDIDGAEHGQSAQQVRFATSGLVRARGGGEQRAITDNSRR